MNPLHNLPDDNNLRHHSKLSIISGIIIIFDKVYNSFQIFNKQVRNSGIKPAFGR